MTGSLETESEAARLIGSSGTTPGSGISWPSRATSCLSMYNWRLPRVLSFLFQLRFLFAGCPELICRVLIKRNNARVFQVLQ